MLSNRVRRKFFNYAFYLVLICFVILPESIMSAEPVPSRVLGAAVNGLSQFLSGIPPQDLSHYGFLNEQEIIQAELGEPIRVYTITSDKVIHYEKGKGTDFISLLSPTNLWLFPVVSQGEMRTLLTVDNMNGNWRAVAIGSTGLAKELDKVKTGWPSSDGYEHILVRIWQAKSDFVVLSKGSNIKIKPLGSAIVSLQLQQTARGKRVNLYEASEVMTKLIPIVRRNIQLNNYE